VLEADPLRTSGADPRSFVAVVDKSGDCLRERLVVSDVDEEASPVAKDIGHRADASRNERDAGRHYLERCVREPFPRRTDDTDVKGGDEAARVAPLTTPDDAPADTQIGTDLRKLSAPRAVTDDDEAELWPVRGQPRERPEEDLVLLFESQASDDPDRTCIVG
jgi:hypothetical protein